MNRVSNLLKSLKYSFYLIIHPFKGFWDLKREKKGTVLSASVLVFLLVLVMIFRRQMTGFLVNDYDANTLNVLVQFIIVLLPFFIFCAANWSITTLLEGEGTFRDIYIMCAYALVPVILLNLPMIILSNVFTLDEMSVYLLLDVVSIAWTAMLLLIGLLTVHQFTMAKTIGAVVITIIGMIAIFVLGLLFLSLIQQVANFARIIYFELFQR